MGIDGPRKVAGPENPEDRFDSFRTSEMDGIVSGKVKNMAP